MPDSRHHQRNCAGVVNWSVVIDRPTGGTVFSMVWRAMSLQSGRGGYFYWYVLCDSRVLR